MKQTARALKYAARAVATLIRNAGTHLASDSFNSLVNTSDLAAMMVNRQRLKHRIMRHFQEHTGNLHAPNSTLICRKMKTVIFGQKETPPSAPHKYDL